MRISFHHAIVQVMDGVEKASRAEVSNFCKLIALVDFRTGHKEILRSLEALIERSGLSSKRGLIPHYMDAANYLRETIAAETKDRDHQL